MKKENIIKADESRQAVDTIRAYAYQIYQSIYSWISLKDNNTIILEGAEDFDIYDGQNVQTVQVKNISRNITLRSECVVDAINNFWSCQKKNKDYIVSYHFLTTAERTYEKSHKFPDGYNGLDYWDFIRDNQLETSLLKDFLLKLRLDNDLKSFLTNSSSQQVLDNLISRIYWNTGRKSSDVIKEAIDNKISYDGNKIGVANPDLENIRSILFETTIDTITNKDLRLLTYKDYSDILVHKTKVSISREQLSFFLESTKPNINLSSLFSNLQGLASSFDQANLSTNINYSIPPLINGVSRRSELVEKLKKILFKHKILILNGSTGTGKSIVAHLLINGIKANWSWLNLRSVDSNQIKPLLKLTEDSVKSGELSPFLVIDDFNFDASYRKIELTLNSLLFHIRNENGKVIITGAKKPHNQFLIKAWINKESIQDCHYFIDEEIKELIQINKCNNKDLISSYVKLIKATSNNGHPQLCHVRVIHFLERNWPKLTKEDLLLTKDIKSEKQNIRSRLIEEISSEDDRNMIYRISVFSSYFTKKVANSLGEIEPKISVPGESFERLIGPWIENVGNEMYRLTPLLIGSYNEVLNDEQIKSIKIAAVKAILIQKAITPSEGNDALIFSLSTKSETLLMMITSAINLAPPHIKHQLNIYLYWLSFYALKRGEKIYESNPQINLMLRLIQFEIVAASKEKSEAVTVLERWYEDIEESEKKQNIKHNDYSKIIYYSKLLINISVPLSFNIIFDSIINLINIFTVSKDDNLNNIRKNKIISRKKPKDIFLLIIEIQFGRIKSIDTLNDFFNSLNSLNEDHRNFFIGYFKKCESGIIGTSFSAAWINEVDKKKPDFPYTIKILSKAAQKGVLWGYEEITTSAYETISILLNEYMHNPKKAFNVLDQAISDSGKTNFVIENQRANINYHQKEYNKALKIWEGIFPVFRKVSKFGNIVFSERLAAISAAYIGDWDKSGKYFAAAAKSAKKVKSSNLRIIELGCKVDESFVLWKNNEKERALKKLFETAKKIKNLHNSINNLYSYTLIRRFGHVLSWLNQDQKNEYIDGFFEPPPGCVSNPDVTDKINEIPSVPDAYYWHLICELEKSLNIDLGANKIFLNESKKAKSPQIDFFVSFNKINDSFIILKLDNLVILYKEFIDNAKLSFQIRKNGIATNNNQEKINYIKESLNSENVILGLYNLLILAITKIAFKKGSTNIPNKKWNDDCIKIGLLDKQIDDLLKKHENLCLKPSNELLPMINNGDIHENTRFVASLSIAIRDDCKPETIFLSHIFLLMFLLPRVWCNHRIIDNDLEHIIKNSWKKIIKERRFSLITPNVTVPLIEEALSSSKEGFNKIALILLAAVQSINIRINQNQIDNLKEVVNRKFIQQ